jgi:hypothetical protein
VLLERRGGARAHQPRGHRAPGLPGPQRGRWRAAVLRRRQRPEPSRDLHPPGLGGARVRARQRVPSALQPDLVGRRHRDGVRRGCAMLSGVRARGRGLCARSRPRRRGVLASGDRGGHRRPDELGRGRARHAPGSRPACRRRLCIAGHGPAGRARRRRGSACVRAAPRRRQPARLCLGDPDIGACPLAVPGYRDPCQQLNDEQGRSGCEGVESP